MKLGLVCSVLLLYVCNEASACVSSACLENGLQDNDCCGGDNSVSCAPGHTLSLTAQNGCFWNSGTCCMPHSSNTLSTSSAYDCGTFEFQVFGNTICYGTPDVADRMPSGTCVPAPAEVRSGRYFDWPVLNDHWGLRPVSENSVNGNSGYGRTGCEAALTVEEGVDFDIGQCTLADRSKRSSFKVICAPPLSSDDNTAIIAGAVGGGVGALLLVIVIVFVVIVCLKKAKNLDGVQQGAASVVTPVAAGADAIQGVAMAVPQPQDIVAKLKELKGLLDTGMLTSEEFEAQKKLVLEARSV